MPRLRCICYAGFFAALLSVPAGAEESQLKGKLGVHDGVRVLTLWGNDYDRGYAHGYLLGEEILSFAVKALLDPRVLNSKAAYQTKVLRGTIPRMRFEPQYERELEGLMAGIAAKVGDKGLYQQEFGRPFDLRDLKALNTLADWYAFYCSSVSAWGSAQADNQVMTVRNLDYLKLPGIIDQQLVVVHKPADPERASWVSIGWIGLIGCYTGMNEHGVTISMHDSSPGERSTDEGFVPRSLALRDALEAARPDHALDTVGKILREHPGMFGNNVHVSTPYDGQHPPAAVFEYDSNGRKKGGVTRRTSADNLSALPQNVLICTNHYRLRSAPTPCPRYERLRQSLISLGSSQKPVTRDDAFRLMKSVAVWDENQLTAHTIYMLPNSRDFYLSLATRQAAAPNGCIVHFKLDDLLK